MNDKVKNEALENMSVEELMDLNVEQINEMVFVLLPIGLYAGAVLPWELPNEENNNSFVCSLDVQSVIELANPEEPLPEITEELKVGARYGKEFQGAIRAMRTQWNDVFVKIGDGNVGAGIANSPGTQVVFKIEHRKVANKDTKEVKTYPEIKDVTVAT